MQADDERTHGEYLDLPSFFFFFGSICIPAYSSVNKPGRSDKPLHIRDICYEVPRVKRQYSESKNSK
jgi:hypothetical protein